MCCYLTYPPQFRFADAKTRRLLFFHISKAKSVWEARTADEAAQLERSIASAVAAEQKRVLSEDEGRSSGGSDVRVSGGSFGRVGGANDGGQRRSFNSSPSSESLMGMLSKGVSGKFISEKASAALQQPGAIMKGIGSKIGDRLLASSKTPPPGGDISPAPERSDEDEGADVLPSAGTMLSTSMQMPEGDESEEIQENSVEASAMSSVDNSSSQIQADDRKLRH